MFPSNLSIILSLASWFHPLPSIAVLVVLAAAHAHHPTVHRGHRGVPVLPVIVLLVSDVLFVSTFLSVRAVLWFRTVPAVSIALFLQIVKVFHIVLCVSVVLDWCVLVPGAVSTCSSVLVLRVWGISIQDILI